jgi:hypothetical protein
MSRISVAQFSEALPLPSDKGAGSTRNRTQERSTGQAGITLDRRHGSGAGLASQKFALDFRNRQLLTRKPFRPRQRQDYTAVDNKYRGTASRMRQVRLKALLSKRIDEFLNVHRPTENSGPRSFQAAKPSVIPLPFANKGQLYLNHISEGFNGVSGLEQLASQTCLSKLLGASTTSAPQLPELV